jgi:hypothetical protein
MTSVPFLRFFAGARVGNHHMIEGPDQKCPGNAINETGKKKRMDNCVAETWSRSSCGINVGNCLGANDRDAYKNGKCLRRKSILTNPPASSKSIH